MVVLLADENILTVSKMYSYPKLAITIDSALFLSTRV